jgi:uncharacterized protein (TIRG00374 family)
MDPVKRPGEPFPDTDDLTLDRGPLTPPIAATPSPLPDINRLVRPRLPSAFLSKSWNLPVADQSTGHLMQLSGMMRPLRTPGRSTAPLAVTAEEDGYWPLGIQQTGPLPIRNLYGREPFGRTLPPAVPVVMPGQGARGQPLWRRIAGAPACKISLGLLTGLSLLVLVARFIDLRQSLLILQAHLATAQGIALAVLAGLAYLAGHSLRGVRWKLFLRPLAQISTWQAIELYQVAIFLNFLLPMRAGEAAKSLALKRIANIPISRSLPTVAMDKALDLVPAPIIVALVPLLGVHMDLQLWLVLGLVCAVLLGLLLFIALAAWKRPLALALLQRCLGLLPRALGVRVEGFATGFVDALLAAASRPAVFAPALLLTALAVLCDGLFAMLAFWAVGVPLALGPALSGYMVYTMFYILPTPPGQIGSNEAVGLLVFAGLFHVPGEGVTAMYMFSHPWAALLMTVVGLTCLAALGLTIAGATRVQSE